MHLLLIRFAKSITDIGGRKKWENSKHNKTPNFGQIYFYHHNRHNFESLAPPDRSSTYNSIVENSVKKKVAWRIFRLDYVYLIIINYQKLWVCALRLVYIIHVHQFMHTESWMDKRNTHKFDGAGCREAVHVGNFTIFWFWICILKSQMHRLNSGITISQIRINSVAVMNISI